MYSSSRFSVGVKTFNRVKESGEKDAFAMRPELTIFGLSVLFCTDLATRAAVFRSYFW